MVVNQTLYLLDDKASSPPIGDRDPALRRGRWQSCDEALKGIRMPQPVVAIIGRPNVGKSTLFNRLVGKRLALVDDRPGVTRDRREGDAQLLGLDFRIIDTAGYEDEDPASLPAGCASRPRRRCAMPMSRCSSSMRAPA